jgi:hypothetical protein
MASIQYTRDSADRHVRDFGDILDSVGHGSFSQKYLPRSSGKNYYAPVWAGKSAKDSETVDAVPDVCFLVANIAYSDTEESNVCASYGQCQKLR